jgi:hypothetical protein
VGPLSHNQIVCIALFIIFTGLILKNILFKDEQPASKNNNEKDANVNESAQLIGENK